MKSLSVEIDGFGRTDEYRLLIDGGLEPQDLVWFIQMRIPMNVVDVAYKHLRDGAQISGCEYNYPIELSVNSAGHDVKEGGQKLLNLLASLPAEKREVVIKRL